MPRSIPASEILALRLPAHLPPLSRIIVTLGLMLARWEERRRSRAALSRLDHHLLKDVGLTETRRQTEVSKNFWQP